MGSSYKVELSKGGSVQYVMLDSADSNNRVY